MRSCAAKLSHGPRGSLSSTRCATQSILPTTADKSNSDVAAAVPSLDPLCDVNEGKVMQAGDCLIVYSFPSHNSEKILTAEGIQLFNSAAANDRGSYARIRARGDADVASSSESQSVTRRSRIWMLLPRQNTNYVDHSKATKIAGNATDSSLLGRVQMGWSGCLALLKWVHQWRTSISLIGEIWCELFRKDRNQNQTMLTCQNDDELETARTNKEKTAFMASVGNFNDYNLMDLLEYEELARKGNPVAVNCFNIAALVGENRDITFDSNVISRILFLVSHV